jgi:hypothetical protein
MISRGLRYKDEPAIATLLITNENDVTHHFGNALLRDQRVPKHTALYMKQVEAFSGKVRSAQRQGLALVGARPRQDFPQ